MFSIKAKATKLIDNSSYPEIVLCEIVDIDGQKHEFIEKWPVVSAEDFDNYNSDKYEYVGFVGTLEQNGSYYNVDVDGATIIGDIENPVQDLSAYNNQKVYVEGYYLGMNSDAQGNKYLNIALTKISTLDNEGSTNDVLPGDDITVTN